MGFSVISNLVALAGAKRKGSAIFELCMEFSIETQQNVAFNAPMICQVARCVFDHADSDRAEILCFPVSNACFTRMMRGGDSAPVRCRKRDLVDFHRVLEFGENYG